jgi:hypothetical protein
VAFLRHASDENVLVVANLADDPVASVTLDLDSGPLCGVGSVEVLHGTADLALPTINAEGGFDGYRPVERLGPREALVIGLGR